MNADCFFTGFFERTWSHARGSGLQDVWSLYLRRLFRRLEPPGLGPGKIPQEYSETMPDFDITERTVYH
jgi:hypothetical protein